VARPSEEARVIAGRTRRGIWWIAASVVLLAGACADDGTDSSGGPSTTADEADLADPLYAGDGPYEVGVTTLELPDRSVEVYYPAAEGSTDGQPLDSYEQTDPIPPELLASLPPIPADAELTQQVPAVRDVPVSTDGPFPLVLFSHGAGGWDTLYGTPLSGLASWGFVVASTDYLEYGLVAQLTGGGSGDEDQTEAEALAAREERRAQAVGVADATIDLMTGQNEAAGGRFEGAIDLDLIGGVGHSAGGGTMFGLLDDPRVGAIVGWAPVGPPTPVTSDTPTMIVAGAEDIAVTEADVRESFDELQPPKRLVVVDGMGHNAFSDICQPIQQGNDLLGLAVQLGLPIPDRLIELGRDGCEPDSLDTATGWEVIQHFTVAALRDGLGLDTEPVGLNQATADAFDGVTITYEEDTT
jgi:predicted dienelactone hydrolase